MYASETEQKVIDLIEKASDDLSEMKDNLEGIEDRLDEYTRLFDCDYELSDLDGYNDLNYQSDDELKSKMKELIEIHNRLETVIKEYEDKVLEIF